MLRTYDFRPLAIIFCKIAANIYHKIAAEIYRKIKRWYKSIDLSIQDNCKNKR